MNKSESIGQFAAALAAAQAVIKPAIKSADNPFFKSKYADLSAVWDVIREPLTANGLAVIQTTDTTESGVVVETILAHKSGEWVSGTLRMPVNKSDAQAVGSAITYARRYALAAMVGVVADVDDDANAASESTRNAKTTKAPTAPTKTAQNAPKPSKADNEHTEALTEVSELCKKLNEIGDSIKWTPAALTKFSRELLGTPLSELTTVGVLQLAQELNERLSAYQADLDHAAQAGADAMADAEGTTEN